MEKEHFIRMQIADMLEGKPREEILELISSTKTLMTYYRCAMLEIETKFRVLDEQFSLSHERNPIENIKSRLKSMDSIQEKLTRKNLPMNLSSIEYNLCDVAGVRVICSFIDDIYRLADSFLSQDDVKLIAKKDYIQSPKENGYRSLHLIVEIPIFLYSEKKYVKVEVQLRTVAMEAWSNLEHKLRYKRSLSERQLALISNELSECAELADRLDIKMQQIRDIIK
nr:GTP pyrophosphokinase family protein [Clostridia bacterium]